MGISLIPFILFLNVSLAEDISHSSLKEPILTISEINKGTLFNGPALECNNSVEVIKKNNKNLFNQCAIDLCGKPAKNISQYVGDDQFYNSASFFKKLSIDSNTPLFEKVYDTAIKRKIKELEDLETYLKNPSLENLSLESQTRLASDFFSPYITITTKPDEKLLENRIVITTSIPQGASNELKEAINDHAIKLKKSVTTNPKKFSSLGIYTDDELAGIIRDMIEKVKESYQGNPESLKDLPKFAEDLRTLEKMYEGATPARAYMEMHLYGIVNINNHIAKTTKKDVLSQVVCDAPYCKKIYTQFMQKNMNREIVEKNIATYREVLKDPSTLTSSINRCKSYIIFNEKKHSDMKKAQEVFLVAKDNVIKNLLPRFSTHSREIMTNYLNHYLEVNNLNRNATSGLGNFTAMAEEYLKEDPNKDAVDDYNRWRLAKQLNDSFENIDPFENIYTCQQTTSTAWDVFIAMDLVKQRGTEDEKKLFAHHGNIDQVYASDFSCQNAEHGHHILAHEIGHALNHLVLKEKLSESSLALYNKARACITSNYDGATISSQERSIFHEGDGPYSEEDTADLFAALSTPGKKKIYMCALLQKSPMSDSYSNLSFLRPDSRHATPITRVIYEAIYRDIPLPQSCQRLIEEEKPAMRFNKCEL